MKIYSQENYQPLLQRGGFEDEQRLAIVKGIVSDVKTNGDKALFAYAEKFDDTCLTAQTIAVSQEEIDEAYRVIDKELLTSLRLAVKNILAYHSRKIMQDDVHTDELGRTTGYVVRAVEKAGIYVPGGTAPLFSSVCMGILPAKAAGVEHIYVTTPAKSGKINPATLVAAVECGAEKIFKIGGAQAIAALAYGTESVPKVNVIAGPGNIFVTLAKKEVYGQVGIDMLAGPSEILIVCDQNANPAYVAADTLSQAEHDKLARSIVLTDSMEFALKLQTEIENQLALLPRREIAEYSLANNGGIVVLDSLSKAIDIANEVAPEHMEIYADNCDELLKGVKNAGAVFLGGYTPEPVGDYFAGPDHILPTGGTAKFFQVLNQDIFLRKMSVIKYSQKAIQADGEHIVRLAENEGLAAHANAVKVRLQK
ncbi:MAG: histidinol dehydrogenase [Clostridia bacterium]|nr:histidinol dehydrogenase [Clostridia bacterium]MBR7099770.1 histidinol dehydrogenase [Clostridia bacterium]